MQAYAFVGAFCQSVQAGPGFSCWLAEQLSIHHWLPLEYIPSKNITIIQKVHPIQIWPTKHTTDSTTVKSPTICLTTKNFLLKLRSVFVTKINLYPNLFSLHHNKIIPGFSTICCTAYFIPQKQTTGGWYGSIHEYN